jgi:hypothetical protein
MDEARQVLERLERIEALRNDGASAAALLVEVRGLLNEGERWLAAERSEGTDRARSALAECRESLLSEREGVVAAGSL